MYSKSAFRHHQEARDQVKKMGETLRTLNGIFRNMQTDVETMRAADLKDQVRLRLRHSKTFLRGRRRAKDCVGGKVTDNVSLYPRLSSSGESCTRRRWSWPS